MTDSPDYSQPSVPLAAGPMPLLGFGTWQLSDDEAEQATATALEVGYRHIDTATMYRNEAGIGRALAASDVPRDRVFVTTKILPDAVGRERETIESSLSKLQTDHVDLWLVHAPPRGSESVALWREVVKARDEGLTTSVGVSNYSLAQIDELTEATGVTPAVNQIRWAPALFDQTIVDGLDQRGIVLEGYSPFKVSDLDDPTFAEIASAHDATAPQVIVAWHAAHRFVVIPKSSKRERIVANAAGIALRLSDDEVRRIDGLARG